MLSIGFRPRVAAVCLLVGFSGVTTTSAFARGKGHGHGAGTADFTRQQPETAKSQDRSGSSNDNASSRGSQSNKTTDEKAAAEKTTTEKSDATEKTAVKGTGAKSTETSTETKVPDSLAEWFQQLSKPTVAQVVPVVPKTPVVVPKTPTAPKVQAAAPVVAKKSIARTPVAVPELTFERPELLAQQLSGKALERVEALGFKLNGRLALPGTSPAYTRLLAPDGMTAQQAKELLRQELPGQAAEPNQTYSLYRAATSDPATSEILSSTPSTMGTSCGTDRCFGTDAIRWQTRLQSCARNVSIGIIDTGIDQSHGAFSKRRIELRQQPATGHGFGFAKAPDWHGTGVAAILAGDAQSSTPGLVPDARYLVADVFFADRDGLPVTTTAHLLEALGWLETKGVNVINMSLAGPKDELLKAAIASLSRKGIIVVAAVGNEGPIAAPTYPSAYEQVIAVTAVNKDLSNYRYANRGNHIDLAAPGVGIWTAIPGGKSGYHTGTSFAAPYVTAIVAAIYNSLPTKSKAEALAHMTYKDLGVAGRDPIYGRGLVLAPSSCAPAVPSPSAFVTTVSIRKP